MIHLRGITTIFFLTMSGVSVGMEPLDLPQDNFRYSFDNADNAPFVHPRILQELAGSLADDGDQIVSINLLDAQGSDRYSGRITSDGDEDGDHPYVSSEMGRETFGYSYVGMTANGIHVLLTAYSGGGSGTFKNLLLVTLERDLALGIDPDQGRIHFGRPRLLLKNVGRIQLGDRWAGELRVDGNRLYIGEDTGWFGASETFPNPAQKLVGWHDMGAFQDPE